VTDLGIFAPGFVTWQRALALAPDDDTRLVVFHNACLEVATYVRHGLDKTVAADKLTEMMDAHSADLDEVQHEIAEAFRYVEPLDQVPDDIEPPHGKSNGKGTADLNVWDSGEMFDTIQPREWLLGNQFCRGFISSLVAAGGVGKTALRMLQFMSMALGRPLCGQHIFRRSRVLILNFEDDENEMKRRIVAVLKHYGIEQRELKGWLLFSSPPKRSKLAQMVKHNRMVGPLVEQINQAIEQYKPDLVSLDPFVKTHSLEENDSGDMDFVCEMLAEMASRYNIAIDSPHHVHKGIIVPGDADSGRGSSGIKDAARLVYTLCPMNENEAVQFGIDSTSRWSFVRLDPAKINIAVHSSEATWFQIHGENIGNGNADYPAGDTVQVVEPWKPPEKWEGTDSFGLNKILDAIARGIEDGRRYSNAGAATDRAAWPLVRAQYPDKTEAQCKRMIRAWIDTGLLYNDEYQDPKRRDAVKGLFVNEAKRPS